MTSWCLAATTRCVRRSSLLGFVGRWGYRIHALDGPRLGYLCSSAHELNPSARQSTDLESAGRRCDGGGPGLASLSSAASATTPTPAGPRKPARGVDAQLC